MRYSLILFKLLQNHIIEKQTDISIKIPLLNISLSKEELMNGAWEGLLDNANKETSLVISEINGDELKVYMFFADGTFDGFVPATSEELAFCLISDFMRLENEVVEVPDNYQLKDGEELLTNIGWYSYIESTIVCASKHPLTSKK